MPNKARGDEFCVAREILSPRQSRSEGDGRQGLAQYQAKGMRGRAPCRGVSTVINSPFAARSRRKCPKRDIGLASTAKKAQRFMGDRPVTAVDATQRQETRKMLAEAEAKQKQHAPAPKNEIGRWVRAATVKSTEHDREEQRRGS